MMFGLDYDESDVAPKERLVVRRNCGESVFLVGIDAPDCNRIVGIYESYESALGAWHAVRIAMIWDLQERIRRAPELYDGLNEKGLDEYYRDSYRERIKQLLCEDPKGIENNWDDTPYIEEYPLRP